MEGGRERKQERVGERERAGASKKGESVGNGGAGEQDLSFLCCPPCFLTRCQRLTSHHEPKPETPTFVFVLSCAACRYQEAFGEGNPLDGSVFAVERVCAASSRYLCDGSGRTLTLHIWRQ